MTEQTEQHEQKHEVTEALNQRKEYVDILVDQNERVITALERIAVSLENLAWKG